MYDDKLRQAAKVLRERAEECAEESLHPWEVEDDTQREFTTVLDQNGWRVTESADQMWRPVAAYIATMHPGVGLALADWLETDADRHRHPDLCRPDTCSAVRLADLILGGA